MYVDPTYVKTEKLYGKTQDPGWVVGLSNRMATVFSSIWSVSEEPGTVVTYRDLCRKFEKWDPTTVLYCLIGLCELDYIEFACFKYGKRGYVTKVSMLVVRNPPGTFADAYMEAKQRFEDGDYEPEDWTEE